MTDFQKELLKILNTEQTTAKKKTSNHIYLKQGSKELRKLLSEQKKGKKLSDEHKRKLSEAKKDKHWKLVDGKRVWY